MRQTMGKRFVAMALTAALVACTGTLMGAPDRAFKITAPANGATVQGSVVVRLLARGFDDLAYVIFGVDQVRPHSANSLPYRYALNTERLANGPHTLSAWGFSKYGMVASAQPVTIVVANPAAPKPAPKPALPGPMLFVPPEAPPAVAPTAPQEAPGQPAGATPGAPGTKLTVSDEMPQPAPALIEPEAKPAPTALATAEPAAASDTSAIAGEPAACEAPSRADSPRVMVVAIERPDQLSITVDGALLQSDVAPELRGGVSYGPLRALVERIGGRIGWDHASKQATAEADQARLVVVVGRSTAQVDEKELSLAGPVWLGQGRTMVPVRSCGEALRMRVAWEPDRMTVALFSPALAPTVGMLVE